MISDINAQNFIALADGITPCGAVNRVSGRNGTGKTSVGRAILYAITGLGTDLKPAAASFIREQGKPMTVTLSFGDRYLMRKRMKTAQQIIVNGELKTEKELETFIGCPALAFAVMFWPGAFFELDVKARRELFMSITPDEPLQAIFESLLPDCDVKLDWSQSQRKLTETYTQKRLVSERELARIQGQIAECNLNCAAVLSEEERAALEEVQSALQAKLGEIASDLSSIQKRQHEAFAAQNLHDQWKLRVDAKKATEIENIARTERRENLIDPSELQGQRNLLNANLGATTARMEGIAAKGNEVSKRLDAARKIPDLCPTCGSRWPTERPATTIDEGIRGELAREYQAESNAKKQLEAELAEVEKELKKAIENNKSLGRIEPLDVVEAGAEPALLALVDKSETEKLEKARDETARKVTEISMRLRANDDAIKTNTDKSKRLASLKQNEGMFTSAAKQAAEIEATLHPKTGVWAIALKRKLSAISIENFAFEFTETRANGEEVEAFKVVRESDGANVELLSSGEKIKFCLKLSLLIKELCKPSFAACFIEHTDLLDGVPQMAGFQIFAERVTKEGFKFEIVR